MSNGKKYKDEYVEGLKNLLRFDSCPEILIENPTLLIGVKTKEEMVGRVQWANHLDRSLNEKEIKKKHGLIRKKIEEAIRTTLVVGNKESIHFALDKIEKILKQQK